VKGGGVKHLLLIKKIRPEHIEKEVSLLFECLEVPRRVDSYKVVLIKPNIFSQEPSHTGATTDLNLLGEVVDYFKRLGKQVLVGEAGANQFAQTSMFKDMGLEEFCSSRGSKFLNLNIVPTEPVELVIREKRYVFLVPRILLEPLFLVDLPKFKTHLSTRVSWAIKNLYGLLPDKEKWKGHKIGIHETLIALSRRFPVDVVLMDGIVAMKGLGPTMGLPDQKNLLFGALDQFVHDLGLLRLLRITHVPHIEKCLGSKNLDIEYHFLDDDGAQVEAEALEMDLRLPPVLLSRYFCLQNQVFYALAPKLERFFDPKIIPNLLVHKSLVRMARNVQRIIKI
jgi:uncharacterized protein (DUF362 family)